MKKSSLSALLLIISLTLIPACSLITAIMLAADGKLEDPPTPPASATTPTTPTTPAAQGSLIPLEGHNSPTGIWSDGTTMWVADWEDAKIYAYTMPGGGGTGSGGSGAQTVTDGSSVAGRISNFRERHRYSVALGAGQTLTAYTTGSADTFGSLEDSGGTSLAVNDDGGSGRNFRISYTVSTAGTYYIIVGAYFIFTTTGNYQLNVSISGGTSGAPARDSAKDFNTLAAAAPRGIWSDGTTMWAADYVDNKIYAYNMATKARDSAKDFTTLAAAAPQGIWSDGSTMWVADYVDSKIYAYSMADKTRDGAKDFTTLAAAGNTNPEGIWSNGTTMWVTDYADNKIYAYSMADKTRDDTKDLTTLAAYGNTNPKGIWSDGSTMWTADPGTGTIYAYGMPRGTTGGGTGTGTTTPAPKARDSAKDFNTLRAAGNGSPQGIWSDGTTMWVADLQDNKIYAYSMSTKARESAKDFNTLSAAWNMSPEGIWSDGTTMWVPDRQDNKIYAYSMSTKARDSAKDFNTLYTAGNTNPWGLWSDGTTMWVTDMTDDKIYAYSMSTKARDSAKDFNTLAAGNRIPVGLWSDGTTMWVADYDSAKIYAYSMSSKARESAKDFNTLIGAGNRRPVGIWSNGTTMWVGDSDDRIYAYGMAGMVNLRPLSAMSYPVKTVLRAGDTAARTISVPLTNAPMAAQADYAFEPPSSRPDWLNIAGNGTIEGTVPVNAQASASYTIKVTGKGFYAGETRNITFTLNVSDVTARDAAGDFTTLAAGNDSPTALWSDGTTMWAADSPPASGLVKIYAYNIAAKAHDAAKDFTTLVAAGNNDPVGLWSDGITMWAADDVDDKIYAYDMASKARDSAKDFTSLAAAGNNDPAGIWSDGTTMWAADDVDDKIYAYDMASKARDSAKDFTSLAAAGNNIPQGLWSDGSTMWVTDSQDDKIYAYSMSTKARDTNRDFSALSAAGNNEPRGLWSDGNAMWVSDWQDSRIYAYKTAGLVSPPPLASMSMSYEPQGVSRIANAAARRISVPLRGGLPASRADYAFEPPSSKPAWLNLGITGTLSGTVPANAQVSATYTIKVRGRGIYAGETRRVTFSLRVISEPLPAMSYTAQTVSRAGNAAARSISVPLSGALGSSEADYAFEPPSSKPSWLHVRGSGTIEGTLAVNALVSKTYTIKVRGKGAYAGETRNVTFTLNVRGNAFTALGSGNTNPAGIWSDRSTMWVADDVDDKIYAYNMASKARDAAKDFTNLAAAGNNDPVGIWSDGSTMWVADWRDAKIYAYSMRDKTRDSGKDFTALSTGNTSPGGIWSDGRTMWAADWSSNHKIYAYDMNTKAPDGAKDFSIFGAAGNTRAYGIWSDGSTMWAANNMDDKIYAYSMARKTRRRSKDLDVSRAASNNSSRYIWGDGTAMWVSDYADRKISVYSLATKTAVP